MEYAAVGGRSRSTPRPSAAMKYTLYCRVCGMCGAYTYTCVPIHISHMSSIVVVLFPLPLSPRWQLLVPNCAASNGDKQTPRSPRPPAVSTSPKILRFNLYFSLMNRPVYPRPIVDVLWHIASTASGRGMLDAIHAI